MTKTYKDLNVVQQKLIREYYIEENTQVAVSGLLGKVVKKLSPTKENKRKFDEQLTIGHNGCGCFSCVELARIFVDKAPDIKEAIIGEATKDIEAYRSK